METSIASSPSIGKEEVFNPTYESNVHFDWGLEGCAMEMEVDKEEGAMDNVVSEPRSQQQEDDNIFIDPSQENRSAVLAKLQTSHVEVGRDEVEVVGPFFKELQQREMSALLSLRASWSKSKSSGGTRFCDMNIQ
ncbi:hypothetical protein RHGRI_028468 [Rhododendron griersonianum]|uniref:Uncharacterized protein n=1 Tax=Rhododendron griersonianum TaxID=479676 RepID=A0AAV6IKL9_9ERIC|nr:hypothetical protein RHGRI_028468 [Rhododendron griersonianum]